MVSTKLYSVIFIVLFVSATAQALVEAVGLVDSMYWTAFGLIIVLSVVKAIFVAGWFQHLRYEPRGVTYLILTGLAAALALTAAAAYSIQ